MAGAASRKTYAMGSAKPLSGAMGPDFHDQGASTRHVERVQTILA